MAFSDSAEPTLLGETHAEETSARFHPLRDRGILFRSWGDRDIDSTAIEAGDSRRFN